MSKLHDPQAVARATNCDIHAVTATLEPILAALQEQGILSSNTAVGALATVATECSFHPVHEAYYLSESAQNAYFDKSKYGKVDPLTHQRYYGRGMIQLTWKSNYIYYGQQLGIDLVNHPDLALDIRTASKILALFFKLHGIADLCNAGNWQGVRKAVNGGLNGFGKFLKCVNALLPLANQP